MTVFVCAGCGTVLSARLSRVAFPVYAHQKWGADLLPVLMPAGTYAVDPEPSGPPWRRWSEIEDEEAVARGVFAPVHALSFGSPGAIVVAPGDTRGTMVIADRCGGYCCGLDGSDGPNLACAHCGQPVASRIDDCGLWQAVWFDPDAVRSLPTDEPADPVDPWEPRKREHVPLTDQGGAWSPQWAAVAAACLAHLVAASEATSLAVPGDLSANVFNRALGVLLPSGVPAKTVSFAGPGLTAPADAAILLVPQHPVSGHPWQPSNTAQTVGLSLDIWSQLALPHNHPRPPATGGVPDQVHRDDPLPMHPHGPFRPDWAIFLATLAGIPAVRQPWLRTIYDRVQDRPYAHPF